MEFDALVSVVDRLLTLAVTLLALSLGAAIVLTNIESSVQSCIDAVVLSKLSPAESMGWYGAARTFVGTLVAPSIILSIAAYPRRAPSSR